MKTERSSVSLVAVNVSGAFKPPGGSCSMSCAASMFGICGICVGLTVELYLMGWKWKLIAGSTSMHCSRNEALPGPGWVQGEEEKISASASVEILPTCDSSWTASSEFIAMNWNLWQYVWELCVC